MYSIRTRSRAADIFNTCASLICAMEDDNMVRINSALCMVHHLHVACDGEGVSMAAKSEGVRPTPAPEPLVTSHLG